MFGSTKANSWTVGIDIREDTLKLIALKKDGARYKLMAHAFLSLKNKETIERAFQIPSICQAKIRTSVHDNKIKIAQLTVHTPPPEDEFKAYQWSIAEALKIPLAEYVIRYEILNVDKEKQLTSLVAFAAQQETVTKLVFDLKELGAKSPAIVEPDINALAIDVLFNYDLDASSRYAIIDVSKSVTQLAIISVEGILYYRQCTGVSGLDFMAQASLDMGLEENEVVEQIITESDGQSAHETAMADSMSRYYSKLSIEIQYSIQRYVDSNPNTPVTKIIISGGGAHLFGLEKHIEEATRIPTTLLEPFKKIDTSNFDQRELEDAGARYGIAIGLAL